MSRERAYQVITAASAGFCFGVQKAVDAVYSELEKGGRIYTYGPIIHNETVVADFEKKGVRVVETPEEIAALEEGTLVIRSHGVSRQSCGQIRGSRVHCVDATCPFVKRIHNIVDEESAKGSQIVIIGNAGHPEVEGIMGWSRVPAAVIGTEKEAREYGGDLSRPVCVVSQTTFQPEKFNELVAILQKRRYNMSIVNTICNATHERQEEARKIARIADVMIVIGGRTSSNSAKLYEICRKECPNTVFIQTAEDLALELTGEEKVIGITAGASTPKNIIEEVQNHVRDGKF